LIGLRIKLAAATTGVAANLIGRLALGSTEILKSFIAAFKSFKISVTF
jgi:hypothetical protein